MVKKSQHKVIHVDKKNLDFMLRKYVKEIAPAPTGRVDYNNSSFIGRTARSKKVTLRSGSSTKRQTNSFII